MALPKYLRSPYKGVAEHKHFTITEKLVKNFPRKQTLINSVLAAWDTIHNNSYVGDIRLMDLDGAGAIIGKVMEQLIIKELEKRSRKFWKNQNCKVDKDFVCVDDLYSTECKVSSQKNQIPGSKAQCFESEKRQKHRQGYYLVINYEGSKIKIRLGWLDDDDWTPAKSKSSSFSRVATDIQKRQFITLYEG